MISFISMIYRSFWMAFLIPAAVLTAAPQESVMDLTQAYQQAYARGDYKEFQHIVQRLIELEPNNYKHHYNLAVANALQGNAAGAADALDFLLQADYGLVMRADLDPSFDSIRNDPGFAVIFQRIRDKKTPLNRSQVAFTIPEKDLIPEGIAYDSVSKTFYLSSLQKCKIIAISEEGRISNFKDPMEDGLVPVAGMRVDPERRHLWAASSYAFQNPDIPGELLGTAGVFKYDLRTGALVKKYMLDKEGGHFLNDLTVAPDGDVYITDWMNPAVYHISAESDDIELFFKPPMIPNGIDISSDGEKLYIGGDGLGVLDLITLEFHKVKLPKPMYLAVDGLYWYENSLITVENGGDQKVARYGLNPHGDTIITANRLEAFHPLFNMPTTGAIVGDELFFIANSQLRSYDEEGRILPMDQLDEVKVLKVSLKEK